MVTGTMHRAKALKDVFCIKKDKSPRALVYLCAISNHPHNYFEVGDDSTPPLDVPETSPFLEEGWDVYIPEPEEFSSTFYEEKKSGATDTYWYDWVGTHRKPNNELAELAVAELTSWLGAVQRIHAILTYLSSHYEEVYIGGISTGATLALCTAAHSPVPIAGVLALCGTVGTVSTSVDVEGVSMIDGPGLCKLSPEADKMVRKAVQQRPHIIYTENCEIDTVHPFRFAVAGMHKMKAYLDPKVFLMSLIPHGLVNMGPNGHDPGAVELFMISDFFAAAHKARRRKTRRFEMLPVPAFDVTSPKKIPRTPSTPTPKKRKSSTSARSIEKVECKRTTFSTPRRLIRKLDFS